MNVPEPTNEETLTILKGLAKKYEAQSGQAVLCRTVGRGHSNGCQLDWQEHHKLKYTDEALAACVKFASQYIQDRFLPDKAQLCALRASSCGRMRTIVACTLKLLLADRPSMCWTRPALAFACENPPSSLRRRRKLRTS